MIRDWLLEVSIRGQVIRLAQQPRVVDGVEYASGLEPLSLAEGLDAEVTVAAISPELQDLAEYAEEGTAVLRRLVDGELTTYASGRVSAPAWGARYDPVTLTITRRDASQSGSQVPDASSRVDASTWPVTVGHVIGTEGAVYPVILGYPGYTGATLPETVVPLAVCQWEATTVATTYYAVAEDGEQQITQVEVYHQDADAQWTQGVTLGSDLLGHRMRLATCTTGGSSSIPGSPNAALLGGYSPTGGGGPRALYDVIVYLCRRWGAASVDWARLPQIAPYIERYLVDAWIDSPVSSPWAWIEPLLADLPVEIRQSEAGRYLVPRRWSALASESVGALDVQRAGAVRSSAYVRDGDPINEVSILYREHPEQGWLSQVHVSGDVDAARVVPGALPTTSYTSSALAAASLARYGRRTAAETRTIWWSWDTSTVTQVALSELERQALPAILASYDLPYDTAYREGDVLLLSDEDAGWLDRVAIIDAPPVVGDTTTLLLRVP